MRLQIISDLHMEFGRIDSLYEKMCECKSDVLVLAGDISSSNEIFETLNTIQHDCGKPIIFVIGNHEYYGRSRKNLDIEMMTMKDVNPNIHILIEDSVQIGDVCFIGSTGWWDGSGGHIGMTVKHGLNDFRYIYDLMDEGNLDGIVWGRKSKTFLSNKLFKMRAEEKKTKLCVITHHFPHHRSINPRYAGSPLNACFYNAWEWMFERYHPELWIHGHTHDSFDYIVEDKSRVVCNPQGYPSQHSIPVGDIEKYYKNNGMELTEADIQIYTKTENEKYDPCKVVEI